MSKRPPWRPTKYKKEMCDQAYRYLCQGMSLTETAFYLGINKDTLHEWRKEKPDFSVAIIRGIEGSQAWWERLGRQHVVSIQDDDGRTEYFNAAVWFMNMKNRFKHDWRDKHEVEHSGDLTVEIVRFTKEDLLDD